MPTIFSASSQKASELMALAQEWEDGVICIGKVEPMTNGVVIRDGQGPVDPALFKGHDHFT